MTDEALERMIAKGLVIQLPDGTYQHRDYRPERPMLHYTGWDAICAERLADAKRNR